MPWPAEPSEIAQMLAELYDLQEWGWPDSELGARLIGSPPPEARDYTDITEMNEESFRFGISSGRPASTREKTAVREHPKSKADR